jgi:hypothetical protein
MKRIHWQKKIESGDVRVPFFRLDESQKATRLMMLTDFAAIIEDRHQAAYKAFEEKWKKGT